MKTLRVRIKDKHASCARCHGVRSQYGLNFVNELSFKHTQRTGKFFSAYDLDKHQRANKKQPREGDTRTDCKPQGDSHKLSTRLVKENGAIFVGNGERGRTGKNEHGEIRARCWLVIVQNHASVQMRSRGCMVRGSQRKLHNPDLFGLRHLAQFEAERYRNFK